MNISVKKVMPVILMILSMFFIYEGVFEIGFWDAETGPQGGFYPAIIATILLVCSAIQLIQSIKEDHPKFYAEDIKVVVAGLGIIIFSVTIGMIPTIAIYLILWMKLVEKMEWKKILIFSITTTLVIYLVFGIWLDVQFPMGFIENI